MDSCYASDIDYSSMEAEGLIRKNSQKGKRNRNTRNDDDDSDDNGDRRFKSKNLQAERRRRVKLNDRLLLLRTSVPIITNMTKAAIVKDAITYIKQLEKEVTLLRDELLELETNEDTQLSKEEIKPFINQIDSTEQMTSWGIQPDVKVVTIDENKIWVKVIFQKRMGAVTKLIEALTELGLEFNNTNLTTSKGAAVINSCLEGVCGGSPNVKETKDLIQRVIMNTEIRNLTIN